MTDQKANRAEIGDNRANREVMRALRRSKGRVTLGDVVAETGLPDSLAENTLRSLLATNKGHLEVGEGGDLVYLFDPRLIRRDKRSLSQLILEKMWLAFKLFFKVWIMLMLVIYFIVYVVLILAALAAMSKGNSGGRRRSSRSGGLRLDWLFFVFWTPRHRRGGYSGGWSGSSGSKPPEKPFYKRVFAFVFGPEGDSEDSLQQDRLVMQHIRGRKGVLTAQEYVELTGCTLEQAREEMGRLLGTHGGEVDVTDGGEIVYLFSGLMVSAQGKVTGSDASPAWNKLEPKKTLTGNKSGANALVGALNGFNLLASLTAPIFIFPQLGMGSVVEWYLLVYFPAVFSLLFFVIPALRSFAVRAENHRRALKNMRRMVLKHVYGSIRQSSAVVRSNAVVADVSQTLKRDGWGITPGNISKELDRVAVEYDATIDAEGEGEFLYQYPSLKETYRAADQARTHLRLDSKRVGDIVYSSGDDSHAAEDRELKEFDRKLQEGSDGKQLNN